MYLRCQFFFGIVLLITQTVCAQPSYVTISPEQPNFFDQITITYDANSPDAVIRKADSITTEFLFLTPSHDSLVSMPMTRQGSRWTVSFSMDMMKEKWGIGWLKSRDFLFRFRSEQMVDGNRGRAWYCVLHDDAGIPTKGSYYWLSTKYFYTSISSKFALRKNVDTARALIMKELMHHPDNDAARIYSWSVRHQADRDGKESAAIMEEIDRLYVKYRDSIPPSPYMLYWLRWRGKRLEADALQKQMIERDTTGKLKEIIDLLGSQLYVGETSRSDVGYFGLRASSPEGQLVDRIVKSKEQGKYEYALAQYDSLKKDIPGMRESIILMCINNPKLRARGMTMAQEALDEYFTRDADGLYRPKSPWLGIVGCGYTEKDVVEVYADALEACGKKAELIDFCRGLHTTLKGEAPGLNMRLLRALKNERRYDELLQQGWECLYNQHAMDGTIDYMRYAWVRKGLDEREFDDSLTVVRKRIRPAIRARAAANRVHEEAPKGFLNLIDRTSTQISALKGKVVVLVFWSNWSGFQQRTLEHACERFANDERVRIYAVNALDHREEEERIAGVQELAAKLRCNVRWAVDDGTLASECKLNAMPRTFIIDRNGVVQFHQEPYINAMIDEETLVAQIEMLLDE